MAKLYIGDSQGAPAIVKIEEVAKTKMGLTIDNFIGDVDKNGILSPHIDIKDIDLTGVKEISSRALYRSFYGSDVTNFIADDVVRINGASALESVCYMCGRLKRISFASLEEVVGYSAMENAFYAIANKIDEVYMPKLKRISGNYCMQKAFNTGNSLYPLSYADVFPALEEVEGAYALAETIVYPTSPRRFPRLRKIVGSSYYYEPTFGSFNTTSSSSCVFEFPELTDISGYLFSGNKTGNLELHFAVANQAAIEACDGYDKKWGATNATIYFDL